MVLISDGNPEHVAHAEKKKRFSLKKKIDLSLLSIYSNALNRSITEFAHLFLSHHPI